MLLASDSHGTHTQLAGYVHTNVVLASERTATREGGGATCEGGTNTRECQYECECGYEYDPRSYEYEYSPRVREKTDRANGALY